MSCLEISLLGLPRVAVHGEPVTHYRGDTILALLAYVVMHAGAPCRRTALAGLLWPDDDESSALTNLRQALRRLRTAIGDEDASPPFLQVTRTTIAFNRESDYWLDVDVFAEALDAVRGHAHRSVETCGVCAERLAEAVELHQGEFLAGFSLDSAPFEEWMVVEREEAASYARRALAL
jgi:DNA-binding SARP family transcriptional activator